MTEVTSVRRLRIKIEILSIHCLLPAFAFHLVICFMRCHLFFVNITVIPAWSIICLILVIDSLIS